MCALCVRVSPSDSATFLVVDLDELAEATGVVVVGRLSVSKSLVRKQKETTSAQFNTCRQVITDRYTCQLVSFYLYAQK